MRPNSIHLKTFLCLALTALYMFSVPAEPQAAAAPAKILELCREFNALNSAVRARTINKAAAKEQFSPLIAAIRMEYYAAGGRDYPVSDWVFPLQGYGYKAIGGVRGNGYKLGGYDYFEGNRHTGHPSQDIFIRDRNRRSLDDRNDRPVRVLSLTGGVVVAVETDWDAASALRGGKYLWIYDPTARALVYYAHNSRVFVEIGDLVKPGDFIAEVGRTGLNAHKRRSPTHLHLTCLAIVNGLPVPRNIYRELLRSNLQ